MKKVIIAIVLIILIPILILVGLYFMVKPFQEMADQMLVYAPFGIGESFANKIAAGDNGDQVAEIAVYLLELEQERAIDKLNVIKTDDKDTYDEVIKAMIRLSPNKTERLIKAIKSQKQGAGAIGNILSQIDEERAKEIKVKADFIATLDTIAAGEEIKIILDEDIDPHKTVAEIYQNLTAQKIVDINSRLFEADVAKIMSYLNDEQLNEVKALNQKQKAAKQNIRQQAELLKIKKAEELVTLIANTNTYTIEELAEIYQKIGAKLGGEVLALSGDSAFVNQLTTAIANDYLLAGKEDDFSKDLYKSLNIYKDYDDNLKELVRIYESVDDSKVADIVRRLYWNSDKVEDYSLDSGEVISISDKKLALDLLRSFPPEKIASILSRLDNNLSTEISTKIALPSLE